MKVYIASFFADKDRVAKRSEELASLGIECTSRWAHETVPHTVTIQECSDEYLRETAAVDLDDIIRADKVVLTIPTNEEMVKLPVGSLTRGGRHFESGFMYGLAVAGQLDGVMRPQKEVILLGPKENVFHYLDGISAAGRYPTMRQFATWEEVKAALLEEVNGERSQG